MPHTRPLVLVLAGHDPSSGAGLTADVKTLEANKAYGMSVCTALTYQHESKVEEVEWLSAAQILRPMEVLSQKYQFSWVKIGIVPNSEVLGHILDFLAMHQPKAKIVWDPVLRSSSGADFFSNGAGEWKEYLDRMYLLTPNWLEMQQLFPDQEPMEAARALASQTAVFLKGGHRSDRPGRDELFWGEKHVAYNPKQIAPFAKHGSGCVLASAITAQLARGYDLRRACLRAKTYVSQFLMSHPGLLGYHHR